MRIFLVIIKSDSGVKNAAILYNVTTLKQS